MYFSFYSFGCKLNQLEGEAIIDSFTNNGFDFLPWKNYSGSSLLIINTCTVTSMAEQKARRLIRKALRDEPDAAIVITGCYAQLDSDNIRGMDERLFVIPQDKKDRLLDLGSFLKESRNPEELHNRIELFMVNINKSESETNALFRYRPEKFTLHTRGFIKIQDGCDNSCAYCRVPLARGGSKSKTKDDILQELRSLENRSIPEAVITGVNISQYNDRGIKLPELLDSLITGTKNILLRLSSIEPEALDDIFFSILRNDRILPHFHLSVQSGSSTVLKKMHRIYTGETIKNAVNKLRELKENPFIACDIIAGFPGESREDFEESYELCRELKFAWIHAFPFSPRPGTAAYNFPDKVKQSEITARVKKLGLLAKEGRLNYIKSWEGRVQGAVIEKAGKKLQKNYLSALSFNYLKLLVSLDENDQKTYKEGSLIKCRIVKTHNEFDALAVIIE